MTRLVVVALIACVGFAQDLPTGARWLDHLTGELLPFWDNAAAYGNPAGAFPGTRCDDTTLYNPSKPCPEIRNNSWISPQQRTLVELSRQSYGYGVAFHMTGDPRYLKLMKAGVDYIRANSIDRVNGGMGTTQDIATGLWSPAPADRNAQELGYGLLGMAMYYYLTRDAEVLSDILTLKNYIFDNYYNSNLGSMQWTLKSQEKRLVAQLDQMNTYLILLAPILPEGPAADWKLTAQSLSEIMIYTFYSFDDQLFFLDDNVSLAKAGTDFGHNAKANWMIRWTGLMNDDPSLVAFAENNAAALFPRAFHNDNGSWAEGLFAGGALDIDKSWWIYAELDQYAGTLALRDPSFAQYLPRTYDYWFKYFVDPVYGEVWNSVNGRTNAPVRDLPKHWQWKVNYHSFEHALVGYIVCQQLHGEPVTLYYSFTGSQTVRPYYFYGDVDQITQSTVDGLNVQKVDFVNVR